jgi:tetratricopeptide (TPR) repeat protein
MSTTRELLAQAQTLLAAGRLADAQQCCRQILQSQPHSAQAHDLLGQILGTAGRVDLAEACFRQAIACDGSFVPAQTNLGVALHLQGRLAEAEGAFRAAVALAPGDAELHRKLAGTLEEQGARDEALACCRRAVELQPDHAESQNSLGVLLERQDKLDEAVACLRQAVKLKPDFADAHSNLGAALDRLGKHQEAVASLQRALELRPDSLGALINLGSALEGLGRYEDASAVLHRAVAHNPHSVEARVNLGLVLAWLGRLDEAHSVIERAVALAPRSADAHVNLGLVLERQGRVDEATNCYRRAMELDPNCGEAHLNYAMVLLRGGQFAQGWREYEWRLRCDRSRERPRAGPRWSGEPIAGRTILLGDEQGLGDSMQFVRYAEALKQRGARVIVECRPQLASLFESCPGVDAVVATGTPLPEYDVHALLASVPGVWGTALESIPANVPYLFPAAALVEKWKQELGAVEAFKVGIAWQGNPHNKTDSYRSIPLESFARLAGTAGVRLYSVQMGAGREQLARLTTAPISDLGDRLGDFHNTAAILCNLDLVITCDSAPAHLAGALGLPVWVALAHLADWRWMLERTDSPWYPTMRLYRQSRRGDWHEVFERIATDLAERAKQGG